MWFKAGVEALIFKAYFPQTYILLTFLLALFHIHSITLVIFFFQLPGDQHSIQSP